MKWVLAHASCPTCGGNLKDQQAMLTDEHGYLVLFESQAQAKDWIIKTGGNLEDILIIPEMEAI